MTKAPAERETGTSSHLVLDELKRAIAVEVTRRFSAAEIRAKILANLDRWQRQGAWCTAYDDWKRIAASGDDASLFAAMLGHDDEANRLRQSAPYVGMLPKEVVRRLNEEAFPPDGASRVLMNATMRAADFWGVNSDELAAILGVDSGRLADLRQQAHLEPGSPEFQRAALFVGIWTAIATFCGSNDMARAWLRRPNPGLVDQIPLEVMKRRGDLAALATYAETMLDPGVAMELEGEEYQHWTTGARWVRHRAIAAFGSPENATYWLSSSQPSLAGRVPREVMRTPGGASDVLRVVELIDYGDYI